MILKGGLQPIQLRWRSHTFVYDIKRFYYPPEVRRGEYWRFKEFTVHIVGGGVCIFVNEKWSEYTKYMKDFSNVTMDYEIVTLTITRPNFRKLLIACVYKPPKGKIENCIKFLKDLVVHFQNLNYEIWLLGDFNTDLLRRDDIHSIELLRFIRQTGLKQLIEGITRPNKRGGSCIDLIMSDCIYV